MKKKINLNIQSSLIGNKVKAKKKSAGVEGEDGKQKNIQVKTLMSPEGDLLALYMVEESVFVNPDTNKNETSRKIKVRISQKVFDDATNADPTTKKVYVQWILKTFVNFIKEEKAKGKVICGYGASTKGNTLLQYYGISNSEIKYIAEVNKKRWEVYKAIAQK